MGTRPGLSSARRFGWSGARGYLAVTRREASCINLRLSWMFELRRSLSANKKHPAFNRVMDQFG